MHKKNTDIIELYSYGIFLNCHLNLLHFLFINKNITLYRSIIYLFCFNFLTKFTIKYTIIDIVFHKYWKYNLKTIAIPQLLNTCGMILINDFGSMNDYLNNYLIKFFLFIILNYFISINYNNELSYSITFRYNIALFYYFIYFLLF